MKTYTLACEVDHEPMSWTTEAESMDDAADNFMSMQNVINHLTQAHPEIAQEPDEDMKTDMLSMISEGPAETMASDDM